MWVGVVLEDNQRLAWNELSLPTDPLVASLAGTLRVQEKESRDTRHGCTLIRALRVFRFESSFLSLAGRNPRGGLRGGSELNIH